MSTTKKKDNQLTESLRLWRKWPTSTSSGLTQCTELFYSRFSSQEQLEGPLPISERFSQSAHSRHAHEPWVLRSSGTFCSTWAWWLRLRRLARCTWSFRFRYSVRADGLWAYGWYRVARAWEMSQAYKGFRGDLYVSHFKTRLTRELRPKA